MTYEVMISYLIGIPLHEVDEELEDWPEAGPWFEGRSIWLGPEWRLNAAAGNIARLFDEPHLEHAGEVAVR